MKKMKTLALLFLAVIISSTGLTSCIDEEIDPAVAAIYQNQALLLSSQASLNDAKATYQIALANLQDAYAAAALSAAADDSAESAQDVLSQAAMTQIQVAAAAQSLSEDEEYLSLQIALNAIYLEEALAELELAQLEWEADMVSLQAAIDDAYVSLASGYFNSYMSAKNAAIIQEGLAMMKQSDIEVAQLLIQTAGNVTWEYYLAQQQDILTGLQADLASQEAAAATLASVIADPSTSASLSSELQVSLEENNAAYEALEVDMAVLESEIIPLVEAMEGMGDIEGTYHDAEDDLDEVQEFVEDIEEAIVSLEEDVAEAELALADNPTYLTGLQADIDTAEAAVVTAGVDGDAAVAAAVDATVVAVDAAEAAADAAVDAAQTAADAADAAADAADDVADAAVVTANAAVVTAADALSERDARQTEWDAQETAVNNAASALVTATNAAAANDGAAVELLVLTAEIAAQASAVVEYDLARSLFDADPTGTTYTQDYAGADGELGDHSDTFPDSYREVLTVVTTPQSDAADVMFVGPVYTDGTVAPVVGNYTTNSWGSMVTGGGDDEGNYWNVEFDDLTAPSNVDRFTTATTKKLDADAILETAQADYDTALAAEGVVDQNLVDANTEYNAQVAIFEDNGAAIVLAQGVLDVADAAVVTANAALVTANAAVVTADAAVVTADAAVVAAGVDGVAAVDAAGVTGAAAIVAAETAADAAVDAAETAVEAAEDVLADALICDADCLQQVIDDIEHVLLEANIGLVGMQAMLIEVQAQFDAAEAALEGLLLTLGVDLTELMDMINEYDSMDAQLDALDMEYDMILLVLDAINFDNADLQETLDDMLMGISASNDAIESQEVLIALGSIDEAAAQSVITQLQNELVVIEDQILAYNTLAAEYWDLMLAALAG